MEGKKLLIVTDTPTIWTGLGRISREVAPRLSNHFEVAVAGWHHQPLPTPFKFHIYPLHKGTSDESNQFRVILNNFQPDLILAIGDLWDFGYLTQVIPEYKEHKKEAKIALWVTVDGEYLYPQWSDIVGMFDAVASFSHYGVNELLKLKNNKEYPVIYPGVDSNIFNKFSDDYKWSTKNVIDPSKVFMTLIVGQNCDRKNIAMSLETFAEFQKDKDDVVLFLVTNPRDPFGHDLWEIIKRLGIASKVRIAKDANPRGVVNDIKLNVLYNMSSALLNTAIGEGLGMPLMEAQATGCIPLATDYAAASEIIGDRGCKLNVSELMYGQYGIKRAIVSSKSVVENLNKLYEDWKTEDKALIKEYKNKGLDWVKPYTWDKTAKDLYDLLQISTEEKERSWIKEKVKIKDLKILQVVSSWGKNCGIAEYSKELIESIESSNKTISVFPSNDLPKLITHVKNKNYNVVVFQHEYSFFQDRFMFEKALDELKQMDIKTVIELHTYSPHKTYNDMIIDKADEIIVHCEDFKDKLIMNRPINNVNVVNMGCKEKVAFDLLELKEELGINKKHPIIGSFGFMRDQKGYKEIAGAVLELSKEKYPDIKFLLVSPKHEFGSDVYDEQIYQYFEKIGITDKIIIIREYMPENKLAKVLACADLFVLNYKSSRAGGGNSAAIKTIMRTQRPIIATDTLYFKDLTNEVYKISSTDKNSIKEAIIELYDNPKLRKQYVDRSNVFIEQNSWENISKKHLDIYS